MRSYDDESFKKRKENVRQVSNDKEKKGDFGMSIGILITYSD
jgi:hypothetical protein